MTDQYFILLNEQYNVLAIHESDYGEKVKVLQFTGKICDYIANGDEELIIAFQSGIMEFWKGL